MNATTLYTYLIGSSQALGFTFNLLAHFVKVSENLLFIVQKSRPLVGLNNAWRNRQLNVANAKSKREVENKESRPMYVDLREQLNAMNRSMQTQKQEKALDSERRR